MTHSCQPPSPAELHSLTYGIALWGIFLTLVCGLVTMLAGMRVHNERIEKVGWRMVAAFMIGWPLFQVLYKVGPLGNLFC